MFKIVIVSIAVTIVDGRGDKTIYVTDRAVALLLEQTFFATSRIR